MNRLRLRPVGNLVLVKVIKQEHYKGIVFPDGMDGQWTSPQGIVEAAGPDCKWVKEGDRVVAHLNTVISMVRMQVGNGVEEFAACTEDKLVGVVLSGDEALEGDAD